MLSELAAFNVKSVSDLLGPDAEAALAEVIENRQKAVDSALRALSLQVMRPRFPVANIPSFPSWSELLGVLGRGVEPYDRRTVEDIVQKVERKNYPFSTLVIEIVKSKPFGMRNGEAGGKG